MDSRTLFELIGTADEQMLEHSEWTAPQGRYKLSVKKALIFIAAVISVFAVTLTAAAVGGGIDVLSLISDAYSESDLDYVPNQNVIRSQIDKGEWIDLNGSNIAVIVPESPVKIMLSGDGGTTWRESVVKGSEEMEHWGSFDEVQYYGGYIGFFGESGGYLVLTAAVRMNNQPMRIYLTGDGGDTWSEIGNPYSSTHISVLTGAGFSTDQIGFISYRYYEDLGPDIWWTQDGGDTWEKLQVTIPEEYSEYAFMPGTPVFDGPNGTYPITYYDHNAPDPEDAFRTLYMRTSDYGLTWTFESDN